MLRPGMLLLCSQFGKPRESQYCLAACLELLHMATLVHDDVIDDAPLRRGKPAVHTQFGKRDAVLVGDYLLSRSLLLASDYTSPDNARYLARLISIICVMEIEQNSARFKSNFSLRQYIRKIIGKSAMLFSLACYAGASEAKAPLRICTQLRRIGYNIGIAFQIIDDILDYSGDLQQMGKPPGSDISEGLITLPLICAQSRDSSGELRRLFQKEGFNPEDSPAILELVKKHGGVEGAGQYAEKYTRRALREIDALPPGGPRDMMELLAQRLLTRIS